MHRTVWNAEDFGRTGRWGAATASIDWCEGNYEYTQYIAELFNTLSNIGFIALAIYGIRKDLQERMPLRFLLCHVGLVVIGLGSALFHMTLSYSWQLCDELPMIFVSTLFTWVTFDLRPINAKSVNWGLPLFLIFFNFAFTWAYLLFPDPVFHQLAYGTLVATTTARAIWLLFYKMRDTPQNISRNNQTRVIQSIGGFFFMSAFLIWNLDNWFCGYSTDQKKRLGVPLKWLLEGHAWWHLGTGLGVYFMIASMTYITLCVRDAPEHYQIKYVFGFLPEVRRTEAGWKAIGEPKSSFDQVDQVPSKIRSNGVSKTHKNGITKRKEF